ncbi:DMT family transporter [Geobacillus sp. LEMMY01]|uniref:DMT family transporter n=1 Tax=Geobacillus sp. LEMMY01 TaxID=1954237 RepID=UPI0009ADD873|nr:DMT family transporter [Geobacillus sp. LEMMY01]OPX02931.1 EamA family transporter [Geobacillus sp. LEMMY01]
MKQQTIADLSLLVVTFVWGATFVVVQNAISFLEPLSFNAVRFSLAGLLLLTWIAAASRPLLGQLSWRLIGAGAWMGLWLFCGYAFQTIGLLYTTSSKAGFITGLSVVLVPLFSFLILKQKPSVNAVVGAALATFGLYWLTGGAELSPNRGDLFVFFCAISFAMHIIVTGQYSSRYSTLLLTMVQIFTVAVLCFFFAFWFEDAAQMWNMAVLRRPEVWGALAVTSLLATTAAFLIQTAVQKYTTPAHVALIFTMEPVFAALTAYLWAGERLSPSAWLGGAAILAGMIFAELPSMRLWGRRWREKRNIPS